MNSAQAAGRAASLRHWSLRLPYLDVGSAEHNGQLCGRHSGRLLATGSESNPDPRYTGSELRTLAAARREVWHQVQQDAEENFPSCSLTLDAFWYYAELVAWRYPRDVVKDVQLSDAAEALTTALCVIVGQDAIRACDSFEGFKRWLQRWCQYYPVQKPWFRFHADGKIPRNKKREIFLGYSSRDLTDGPDYGHAAQLLGASSDDEVQDYNGIEQKADTTTPNPLDALTVREDWLGDRIREIRLGHAYLDALPTVDTSSVKMVPPVMPLGSPARKQWLRERRKAKGQTILKHNYRLAGPVAAELAAASDHEQAVILRAQELEQDVLDSGYTEDEIKACPAWTELVVNRPDHPEDRVDPDHRRLSRIASESAFQIAAIRSRGESIRRHFRYACDKQKSAVLVNQIMQNQTARALPA